MEIISKKCLKGFFYNTFLTCEDVESKRDAFVSFAAGNDYSEILSKIDDGYFDEYFKEENPSLKELEKLI